MKTTIVLALLALFACATYVEAQEKIRECLAVF
jgi:hypothetical protein